MDNLPQVTLTSKNNQSNHEENKNTNISNDIEKFEKLRKSNINNPIIAYYNINSLRNKIHDIRDIISRTLPDEHISKPSFRYGHSFDSLILHYTPI